MMVVCASVEFLVWRKRLACILALHPSRYGDATARSGLYRSGEDAGQPLHDLSIQTSRKDVALHALSTCQLAGRGCLPAVEEAWS